MTVHELLAEQFPSVPMTSSKGAIKRAVAWDQMTLETIAHLAWHGLKQKANDPLGAKELSSSEKTTLFNKVVDAFEANELRVNAIRTVDVFEKKLASIAGTVAKKRAAKDGFKVLVNGKPTAEYVAAFTAAKAREDVIALARKQADEEAALELVD